MEPGLTASLATPATATAGDDFTSVDELERGLRDQRYVAERGLATTLFLTLKLGKPLLLEGEAGVGKTEIAKVLADVLARRSSASSATRDSTRPPRSTSGTTRARCSTCAPSRPPAARAGRRSATTSSPRSSSSSGPLLQAIDAAHDRAPVLLIDEVDRADQELEAFLLEILSDFQVTVPEIGTIRAEHVPVVILTSNRTREIHDALKRRCLYHWIDFPITTRSSASCRPACRRRRRTWRGRSSPSPRGCAGSISSSRRGWPRRSTGRALLALGTVDLNEQAVDDSLGVILKYQEDVDTCAAMSRRTWSAAPCCRSDGRQSDDRASDRRRRPRYRQSPPTFAATC